MDSSPAAFDHATHNNQVVAMYATDGEAQAAKASLITAGIPATAVQVVYRGDEAMIPRPKEDSGIWGAITSLFVPDEDRNSFTHAVSHGHALLLVTPTPGLDRHTLIQALEASHPVDFDAKLEEWKMAGYDYSTPHKHYAAATQSAGGAAPVGFASGTGGNTGPIGGGIAADTMSGGAATTARPDTGGLGTARTGQRERIPGTSRVRSYVMPRDPAPRS